MILNEWFDKSLYDKIVFMWDSVETAWTKFNTARETIAEYFRLDLDIDVDDAHSGNLLGHGIYEGTAPWAARIMAVGLQSNQYSKGIDWIDYAMSDDRLNGIDEIDKFCQEIRLHNTQVYQRGNFYDVQPRFSLDAVTLGSPCMFGEEDLETEEIIWTPLHYKTYRLFYERNNRLNGIIIKDDSWTVRQVYDKFCTGNNRNERIAKAEKYFSDGLKTLIEKGDFDKPWTIWRAVFKRDNPLWYGVKKLPSAGHKWIDVYFEDTPKDKDVILGEISGYFSKPFVVWDYDKQKHEVAARTPAFEAVYDNLTLQNIFKNYIENTQQKVRPAMWGLDELYGKYDLSPGGMTYAGRNQYAMPPVPIGNTGDVRFELEQEKLLEEKVKRYFQTDLFNIMMQLSQQNRQITATQILEIADEKITLISPMLESNDNYLAQADERVMDIEYRSGRGPFNRDRLNEIAEIIHSEVGDGEYKIVPEFIGKLRLAQQMAQRLKPIRMGLAVAQEIGATLGQPELPAIAINGYDILDKALSAVKFPMDSFKPKKEFENDMAAFQQSQAQQAQFNNQIELMKAMKGKELPVNEQAA
jgi:hypothetical protein